jgi:acetyl-CoA synthetase
VGFQPGDAIAIDMPMTAESVAIYLGIIKAGCVVVSIADSFAANEIATRLHLSQAKGIFTQDCIRRAGKQLPLYAKVVEADAPKAIVLSLESSVSIELRQGDLTWEKFLSPNERFEAVSTHPHAYTNILFSSGTTGEPKAIPWTQTTPIKCAVDGHLHHDIHPKDVVAWPTNLGWMMGPWLIYASLVNRATIALYYGTPTERGFGQFIQDARVTMLGVVPSLVSAWKTNGCMQGLDWSAIKAFSSTGECSNPQDMLFLMSLAGYKPIIEYCGGTEIGGGYITGTLVQPCIPSTFTTPALGLDVVLLNDEGNPADKGEVFIIPPSIGLSTELLNKNHHQVYFANTPCPPLRRHGDQMERLPNGYYRAHGRVDDTMNLGGIKVSSAEIEHVLNTVEEICETVAIAISPPEGGPSQLIIYAVVTPESHKDKQALQSDLQKAIAQHLNPLFKIRDLILVDTLPRTASNKVMRRVLRDFYRVQSVSPQATN